MNHKIPIEVSAKHIHLSQEDLEKLFGRGYELKKLRQLTQPSDFAAEEKLDVLVGDKKITNVRIVGPIREKTQIEISRTDAIALGLDVPLRVSGNIEGTPGAVLVRPNSQIEIIIILKEGLVVVQRHIHCNSKEAEKLGLKNGEDVLVKIEGERAITFHKVRIRVKDDYKLCLHLDTDEGNAAGISKVGEGYLTKE